MSLATGTTLTRWVTTGHRRLFNHPRNRSSLPCRARRAIRFGRQDLGVFEDGHQDSAGRHGFIWDPFRYGFGCVEVDRPSLRYWRSSQDTTEQFFGM